MPPPTILYYHCFCNVDLFASTQLSRADLISHKTAARLRVHPTKLSPPHVLHPIRRLDVHDSRSGSSGNKQPWTAQRGALPSSSPC